MDHTKAYEMIGCLSASVNRAARDLDQAEDQPHLMGWHLSSAKRSLKNAQADYQKFRKGQGWDTEGEK